MLSVKEEDIDRITEAFYRLLKGKPVQPVELPADYPDNELKQAVEYVNRFIGQHTEFSKSMFALSRGELDLEPPKGSTEALQSLKNLHANLRHLTWRTQQIAGGDFSQTVDFMGDFSVAFNSMTLQLRDAFEKIEKQKEELSAAYDTIKQEKEKSDRLLLNVLPAKVADDLKQKGKTTPQSFEDVTVFFSDFLGFTRRSSDLEPKTLIEELNDVFTEFDSIVSRNECERIKTIGDAYLAVCGLPEPDEKHAENIVRSALEIVEYLRRRNAHSAIEWQTRIGIHSGSVVGGVVGVKKYIYDIFGDTVNTASRMESNSESMRVNISQATHSLVKDRFECVEREEIEVKGKGRMKMYFVESAKLNSPIAS
jgi:adenylate cyclase